MEILGISNQIWRMPSHIDHLLFIIIHYYSLLFIIIHYYSSLRANVGALGGAPGGLFLIQPPAHRVFKFHVVFKD